MGKVSLHDVLLLLSLPLDVVELDPLSFYVGEARVLCAQCVNVGNDTCIPEMEEGIVDDEAIVRGGVKDGEVGVSQSRMPKVGNGKGSGVKGDGVEGGVFGPSPL
jgi:hypothetical protein